jgi:hypothetical protein
MVASGTYNEEININKSVKVLGSGASTTFIDGTGVSLASPGLVKITAAGDVTFSGFTVQHAPAAGGVTFGILSQSSVAGVTYTISYNNIYGSNNVSNDQDWGFYSQSDRANVIFTHNMVTQTGCNNIVFELHTGTTEISYNTLDAGVYGIDAIFAMTYNGYDVNSLQNVSYNTFNMGTGEAFDYDHLATAISFCTPDGAYGALTDAKFTNVVIQGNTINNLKSYRRGIGFWNGGGNGGGIIAPVVEGNTITGAKGSKESYGIDFIATGSTPTAAMNATVTYNTILNTSCGIYLRTAGCAPGAQIHYNNIAGNTVGLNNTVGPSDVDARYNWWGSATGPSHSSNPGGSGDPITNNVNYRPWFDFPIGHKYTYADYKAAIVKAANRLVALQSVSTGPPTPPDYGWNWVVTGLTSHSANPSDTNIFGVTALGLIDAYMKTDDPTYQTAASNTAGFMKYGNASAGDFWNGIPPDYNYYWGYSFDYKFLMQFSAEWGDLTYASYAQAAWAWQTSAASGSGYDLSDLRYMDGNQSYLYNYFVNGPGWGGAWQASDYGLAAWEMGDTTWAQHMASVISSNLASMTSVPLGGASKDMGMGWAIKLLVTVDPTRATYGSNITTLINNLKSDQSVDGSWNDEPDTTAYVVMGLWAAGEYTTAQRGADWLVATQMSNGGWSASPTEYSEVDSEALQALAASIVQLKVTSAYDSPNPSGTTSYFSGTSVTASVTSPVSGLGRTQYVCTGWTGTGDVPSSGTETTVTFNITQDSTITWNWKTQYSVTFSQAGVGPDFSGTVMTIDGYPYGRNGVTFWWDAASNHSFSFVSLLHAGSGKQCVWASTTGLSTAQHGTLTVTGSGTVTGNYKTQYQITFDQSGVGSNFNGTIVSIDGMNYSRTGLPAVFWWDADSVHSFSYASPLKIDAQKQYAWNSTSGLSTLQSGSLTINASGSVFGNYALAHAITFDQLGINASEFSGTVVVIDGTNYTAAQLPKSFYWPQNSNHTFAYQSPLTVDANTKQYVWTSTTGLSSLESGSIKVTTYGSIVGNYKTQYFLTVAADPAGLSDALTRNSTGQNGMAGWWYDASTAFTMKATSVAHFSFGHWDIDGKSQGNGVNPVQTVMDAPHSTVGHYILNVAVLNMSAKTIVGCGCKMHIGVIVKNWGSSAETFNVTVYMNTTAIKLWQSVTLEAGSDTTLTYCWNATGWAYGNYTLSASAQIGPGTANYTYGTIKITIPGDIDGSGKVIWKDLVILGRAYGSKPGDDNWNPNADIDGSGKVDWLDLNILGMNYGKSC